MRFPRAALLVTVTMSVLGIASAAGQVSPARVDVGTVTTVVGPGICPGTTVTDPASLAVRALAVDQTGVVHVEVGRAGAGSVVRVDGTGRAELIQTGRRDPEPRRSPAIPGAGPEAKLAADGKGGLVVASGSRLTVFDEAPNPVPGELGRVRTLTADAAGNLYVASALGPGDAVAVTFLNRSQEQKTFYLGTPDELTVAAGTSATIVGAQDGNPGAGDGRARSSRIDSPWLALAVAGDLLYLASSGPGPAGQPTATVSAVNLGGSPASSQGVSLAPGAIVTVAGRSFPLGLVAGIAADAAGNLLVAEPSNHRVLRIDATGGVSTFAGRRTAAGGGGFDGNDRPAATSRLSHPSDVEVGPDGRVYIADEGNGQVRYVDTTGTIRAAFGNGMARSVTCRPAPGSGEPASRTEAPQSAAPGALAADAGGDLYFAVPALGQVKRLDPSGTVTTLAGNAAGKAGSEGGPAVDALLRRPVGLALGVPGALYVLDREDARLRVVNLGSRTLSVNGVTVGSGGIRTVAGTGRPVATGDGGPAAKAGLASLTIGARTDTSGLAADRLGNVFVSGDTGVRRIDPNGIISTIVPASAEGCCAGPGALALDQAGNLYVADHTTTRVWLLNRGQSAVTVHSQTVEPGALAAVAGRGGADGQGFLGDGGPAITAQLSLPASLAVDRQGNLYVAVPSASGDQSIRRVDPSGLITTVVGGRRGFNGDGLKGQVTAVSNPTDVAVDRCGNLLFSETDRVRRLNLAVCPAMVAPPGGGGLPNRLLPWVLGASAAVAVAGYTIVRRTRSAAGGKVPTRR